MKKEKYYEIINDKAFDILNNEKFNSQKKFMQHGKTSTYDHIFNVAIMSLQISNKFNIKCDEKSLIRGALLHDYCLYDWHENDKSHRLHGFRHAKKALINARNDYDLNSIEENIIYTHMFPLNLRLPKYKESIIICLADKVCALLEMFKWSNYERKEKI